MNSEKPLTSILSLRVDYVESSVEHQEGKLSRNDTGIIFLILCLTTVSLLGLDFVLLIYLSDNHVIKNK